MACIWRYRASCVAALATRAWRCSRTSCWRRRCSSCRVSRSFHKILLFCPRCHVDGFDIECFSESGAFPVADKPGDKLIQISTTFQRYGEPQPYARTVVCLGETDDVEGVDITWHAEEHRVIETWAQLLREHKADVLIGYNTAQVSDISRQMRSTLSSRRSASGVH